MTDTAFWFDLDGTLVTFDRSFESMLEATLGSSLSPDVHETFTRELFAALERFDGDPYLSAFRATDEACDLGIDAATAAETYRMEELDAAVPVDGAHELLTVVNSMCSVGILTNGDGPMQRAKIEHLGFEDRVDAIVISNEVGVAKPEPAIFEEARSRLPAERHVYVGDSYEDDIAPAQDASFQPVHVRDDVGPTVSVDRLDSLITLWELCADTH